MGEYGREVALKSGDVEISVAPELGFSLVGFRYRGLEILDTRLKADFLAIRKGLGPLILPHFNQAAAVPEVNGRAFPHIPALQARGVKHPFQHGIGRYVPWEVTVDERAVYGRIDGGMSYRGYSLSELAGYDFSARVAYRVGEEGLEIAFDIAGERPVAAGIHFYYNLFEKTAATVRLPGCAEPGPLRLRLGEAIDKGFALKRLPGRTEAACTLATDRYTLVTRFPAGGAPETSFDSLVVFCPEGGGFACIEPVSYRVGAENTKTRFRASVRLQLAPPLGQPAPPLGQPAPPPAG
jgi:galactose mutarotase-like enzyme